MKRQLQIDLTEWRAALQNPSSICRCGHSPKEHLHGKGCGHEEVFQICRCEVFQEAKSQQEIMMAKEKKARKPKSEGRKPTLAPYVDAPFKIYMTTGGKEYDGTVLSSGIIKIDEKEFTSPSSAGSYILGKDEKGKPRQVDGWKCWSFNKDGERVMLNTLRGGKSPLKIEAAKPRKAKAERSAKPKKARKARKPRAGATEAPTEEVAAAD